VTESRLKAAIEVVLNIDGSPVKRHCGPAISRRMRTIRPSLIRVNLPVSIRA
jgi:hypothetical protein